MTEDEGIRSPLHDAQVAMGAEIIWEDGWPWTNRITDPVEEVHASCRILFWEKQAFHFLRLMRSKQTPNKVSIPAL